MCPVNSAFLPFTQEQLNSLTTMDTFRYPGSGKDFC